MSSSLALDPEEVLNQLIAGAKTNRTIKSLKIINEICKEQHERGSKDFSYETIGKLSSRMGGPKAQPIRNASGEAYRTLICAWEKQAPATVRSKTTSSTNLADDVVNLITDPVARILVQSYISENRKLKHENDTLKNLAKDKITIDLSGREKYNGNAGFEGDHGETKILLPQELEALRSAIDDDFLRSQGWKVHENTGAVMRGPLTLFRPGFISAIKKILNK